MPTDAMEPVLTVISSKHIELGNSQSFSNKQYKREISKKESITSSANLMIGQDMEESLCV